MSYICPSLLEPQDKHMPTCEITPCSPPRISTSSRALNSPISDHRQDLLDNVGAISSRQKEGSPGPLRIIVIALKAHEKMRIEPFAYAMHHLVEQRNCKVVVICCLSKVRNEMGIELSVDLENFGGISRKKLHSAIKDQTNALNYFLKQYKDKLKERGVELDIRVYPGNRSDDILLQMANEVHPCWVVLDHSFNGHQKRLLKALDCNLVLIQTSFRNSKPLILRVTPEHLSPADQPHEQASETFELASARNSVSNSARSSISESGRNSISESGRNLISEMPRNSISERERNFISETGSRNSISNGTNPTITIKASSSNEPTATITVETSVGVHNTTNTATPNIHSQTQSRPPVPIATQGLPTLRSAFTSSPPHLSSPPTAPNPPTQSITPVPPVLSSSSSVRTQGLEGLRFPAPQLSSPATPPPNRPTPMSSGSGTSAGQENQRTSCTPSEPVYALSSGEAPSHTVLQEQSRPPAPPVVSPTPVATLSSSFSSSSAASPNSPSPSKPTRPGSFSALKNYINDIKKAASKPTEGEQNRRTSTHNSSGSGTSTSRTNRPNPWYQTGQAKNRPSPLKPNEQIPYDVELAMALSASILSASREGVPVSPTARQSISLDRPPASWTPPLPDDDDVALAMTLSASMQTASEEGVPLSPPPPQNPPPWNGNLSNTGPPSTTNNAQRRHFGGRVETEYPSYSYSGWGPGASAGTATSTSLQNLRTGASSNQSAALTSLAPSAPPLPTHGATHYHYVDTSPAQVNYGPPGEVMGQAPCTQNANNKEKGGHCIICYDAQANAVCIPCGHVAGCKNCLTRIKSKGCPVCRATIQQVFKVYTVS